MSRLVPVPAGCAALLAVLVYLNALDNPFVYDDFRMIVENRSLAGEWNVRALAMQDMLRPVVNFSYALDTAIWGRAPFGYHVTNVVLHAINVVLVFWVAFLAARDGVTAVAAAALFAVHPMLTQAVGYIASRSEVTYSTFFLLAFLAGRQWMLHRGTPWWIACVALWLAALLTKETAAMLPFVLFAYDRLLLVGDADARRARWLRLELPLMLLTVVAGAARLAVFVFVEYRGQAGFEWPFAVAAVDAFWRYLAMFFIPRGQSVFHDVPVAAGLFSLRAMLAVATVAIFLALAWRLRRTHALLTFGLLWFALLLIPSGVLAAFGRGEPMAEHRAYLPAAGLFMTWGCAFGMLWARAAQWRPAIAGMAVIFVASLSVLTVVRNVVWGDRVGLAEEAVALAPEHWLPRTLLAESLRQSGRCGEAVPEYRRVITIRPGDEFAYTRLARCLVETRRMAEAEQALRKLMAVSPASQDGALTLGVFAAIRGRTAESRDYLEHVLARNPDHAQAARMLAFIDGSLPPHERGLVCDELRLVAGGVLSLDACRN